MAIIARIPGYIYQDISPDTIHQPVSGARDMSELPEDTMTTSMDSLQFAPVPRPELGMCPATLHRLVNPELLETNDYVHSKLAWPIANYL